MTSAAQQDNTEEGFTLQATGTDGSSALRQTVAERLAMHRSRRAAQTRLETPTEAPCREDVRQTTRSGTSRVRDAVTARYENSVSYREYLATEAERALQKAQAEAEVAARNARAVAEAQIQLLQELEQWNKPEPGLREQAVEHARTETRGELAHALADIALGAQELMREAPVSLSWTAPVVEVSTPLEVIQPLSAASQDGRKNVPRDECPDRPLTQVSSGGLTIKLYDSLESAAAGDLKPNRTRTAQRPNTPEELNQLEQEIALRHALELAPPHTLETTPIPANLIEFPRQLIAPRKARPRLAEGPLREEAPAEPQLRIFEVEAEQIAVEPAPAESTGAPGWQELLLESVAVRAHVPPAEAQTQFTLPPQVAPIGRRLLATAVDGILAAGAVAGCAELALHLGGAGMKQLPLPLLGGVLGLGLLCFATMFQMLFFSLNDATPGMRVARLALCTFGDDNPSRRAMRRRVLATLLAACPLGIGLLWTFLDGEELGWHDRMSRMYQRTY